MTTALAKLNALGRDAFADALGGIFEHSPWIPALAWEDRPFDSAAALHTRMVAIVAAASDRQKHDLLAAHPELAGKLARERRLTAASTGEQASLGLDQLEEDEATVFARSNRLYQERFGFPFIIAVRGQKDRRAIHQALLARLDAPPAQEIDTALGEVAKIAWFRLSDLVSE